jgi:hypothetical protein
MKYSKFSLADLITFLAALVFGLVCFLGRNFYTLGNTSQSITWPTIIVVMLSGTAFIAKLLKRTRGNFETCFVWEMIFLVLFTGLTVSFAYLFFPHYFVVWGQKTDIQEKLTANIIQAENMFAEYERYAANRENLYKNKLHSVVIAKSTNPSEYIEYGFENNGIADVKQIANKMFTVHADLFPTNYSDMVNNNGIKEVATTWLVDAKNKIVGWKPIGIVDVANEVEQKSNDWLKTLIELSVVREKGEQAEDFAYNLSFDDVKKHFTTFGKPTPCSIWVTILLYVLMLLPYIFSLRSTKRHKKSTQKDTDII